MDKKYLIYNDFMNKVITGEFNVRTGIKLDDRCQNISCHVGFMEHILHICSTQNKDMLNLLFEIKNKIESNMVTHINRNSYIRNFIDEILDHWNLDLHANNVFDKFFETIDYANYEKKINDFNDLLIGMKNLEKSSMDNEFEATEDTKGLLVILFENYKEYKQESSEMVEQLVQIIKNIEPTYNYVLLDLSMKHKSKYLEFSGEKLATSNETFSRLLTSSNDKKIPDNIDTIFMNYILLINMLKKELHYMITKLNTVLEEVDIQFKLIQTLVEGLDIDIEEKETSFF